MNKKPKGDVAWYIPGRKIPIAYSTVATSDLIVSLAEDGDTIAQVQKKINYDREAIGILQKYVDKGYGNVVAKEWFR